LNNLLVVIWNQEKHLYGYYVCSNFLNRAITKDLIQFIPYNEM